MHCSLTDVDVDTEFQGQRCDFIARNLTKLKPNVIIVIVFLVLLWLLPICQDLEEAHIEEFVLRQHCIRRSISGPAAVIRVGIRYRKYCLPFQTAAATILLIMTEPISSKSAILNFLAVSLILEADSAIAVLFITNDGRQLMEEVIESVEDSARKDYKEKFFWIRSHTLFCGAWLLLIFFVLSWRSSISCDGGIQYFFSSLTICPSIFIAMVKCCYKVMHPKRLNMTLREKVLVPTIDFFFSSGSCILLFALIYTFIYDTDYRVLKKWFDQRFIWLLGLYILGIVFFVMWFGLSRWSVRNYRPTSS